MRKVLAQERCVKPRPSLRKRAAQTFGKERNSERCKLQKRKNLSLATNTSKQSLRIRALPVLLPPGSYSRDHTRQGLKTHLYPTTIAIAAMDQDGAVMAHFRTSSMGKLVIVSLMDEFLPEVLKLDRRRQIYISFPEVGDSLKNHERSLLVWAIHFIRYRIRKIDSRAQFRKRSQEPQAVMEVTPHHMVFVRGSKFLRRKISLIRRC